ncbi:MAG: hypothetical protein AB8B85_00650 [Paracoccaceae bacterium]
MRDFLLPMAGALMVTLIVWSAIGPLVLAHLPVPDSIKGLAQLAIGIAACMLTFDFLRKKLGSGD